MRTDLLYLHDSNLCSNEARVIGVRTEGDILMLMLSATCVYPSRGGQRFESSTRIVSGDKHFFPSDVRVIDGEVWHMGKNFSGRFEEGDLLTVSIDPSERLLHTALHTAGEAIPALIKKLGFRHWNVISAIHYREDRRVEFDSVLDDPAIQTFHNDLQKLFSEAITNKAPVSIQTTSDAKYAYSKCGYYLDQAKSDIGMRLVGVLDNWRYCTGTHFSDLSQLKNVTIDKVKCKKGRTSISYSVAEY